MTEPEIQYQIHRCVDLVDEYLSQQKHLERQHDELSELRDRFNRLQSDFNSRKQSQLTLLKQRMLFASGLRSARSYLEGMQQMIGGSDFLKASNGLSIAVERILHERGEIDRQIEEVERLRTKALDELQYWREQLHMVRLEAQKAEGE